MTRVVGFVADADLWCVDCAAREYGSLVLDHDAPYVEDSEGNPVTAIFDFSESGDTPSHCGSCGEMIDDSLSASAVGYMEDAVRDFLEDGRGNVSVLADWVARAHPWAGFDADLAQSFTHATTCAICGGRILHSLAAAIGSSQVWTRTHEDATQNGAHRLVSFREYEQEQERTDDGDE